MRFHPHNTIPVLHVKFRSQKSCARKLALTFASHNFFIGDHNKFFRFIREGDTASVIGVLKKHHAYDIVDAPSGVVTTGCQFTRCMFPVHVEGLILVGDEDPDDEVYMV